MLAICSRAGRPVCSDVPAEDAYQSAPPPRVPVGVAQLRVERDDCAQGPDDLPVVLPETSEDLDDRLETDHGVRRAKCFGDSSHAAT